MRIRPITSPVCEILSKVYELAMMNNHVSDAV